MYQLSSSSRAVVLLSSRTTIRRCLATAERARSYLDAWVGFSSKGTAPDAQQRLNGKTQNIPPLLLSGSSYLIPTLRIERNDTPQSISTRIAMALEDSYPPTTGLVKSMLRGKETALGRWQAPIILDLQALVPDGSPHYSPPQRGLLVDLVKALGNYGIRVVGVTNTPPILEDEAAQQLALPSFMSKGRVLDRHSTASKFLVEDVVKMILTKTKETAVNEMMDPEVNNKLASDENVSHVRTELEGNDAPLNGAAPLADKSDHEDATMTLPTPGRGTHEASDAPLNEAITLTNKSDDGGMSMLPTLEGGTHGKRDAPLNGATTLAGKSGDKGDNSTLSFQTPEEGTHVYHGSVRSGQQVAAKQNQSLIIIGSVNSGGEVLSDRDIFVFGKLRGRALAGLASENGSARIFSTSFDPELICIGDTFTTVDAVTELGLHRPGEAAMVYLDSRRELVFEPIPL